MSKRKILKSWEYPEEYVINKETQNNHFYLHFGFADNNRIEYENSEGRCLRKYSTLSFREGVKIAK